MIVFSLSLSSEMVCVLEMNTASFRSFWNSVDLRRKPFSRKEEKKEREWLERFQLPHRIKMSLPKWSTILDIKVKLLLTHTTFEFSIDH